MKINGQKILWILPSFKMEYILHHTFWNLNFMVLDGGTMRRIISESLKSILGVNVKTVEGTEEMMRDLGVVLADTVPEEEVRFNALDAMVVGLPESEEGGKRYLFITAAAMGETEVVGGPQKSKIIPIG